MNPDLFQYLLYATCVAVIGLLGYMLRSLINVGIAFLRMKLGETQFGWLYSFATAAVRSVEQNPVFADFDGAKKKELAILAITQYAETHNLPIDHALIDKVIEASVQEMNAEFAKIDWDGIPGELVAVGEAK